MRSQERYIAVFGRGAAITKDPNLNKGTCFTLDERDALGCASPHDLLRRTATHGLGHEEVPNESAADIHLRSLQAPVLGSPRLL